MGDDQWADWIAESALYDVNVIYINADLTPDAFARLPEGTFDGPLHDRRLDLGAARVPR